MNKATQAGLPSIIHSPRFSALPRCHVHTGHCHPDCYFPKGQGGRDRALSIFNRSQKKWIPGLVLPLRSPHKPLSASVSHQQSRKKKKNDGYLAYFTSLWFLLFKNVLPYFLVVELHAPYYKINMNNTCTSQVLKANNPKYRKSALLHSWSFANFPKLFILSPPSALDSANSHTTRHFFHLHT